MSAETDTFVNIGEKNRRQYGLIDPNRINDYQFSIDDSAMLDAFDALLTQTENGKVQLGNKQIRLTHYKEGQNEIRSVVICEPVCDSDKKSCIATSIITDPAGETYIEEHLSLEGEETIIKEPRVGSSVVIAIGYDALLSFNHVAYEAVPLPRVA